MTEEELRKMYEDAGFDPEPYIEQWKYAHKVQDQYDVDHAACPKCGNDKLSSTYVGYVLNIAHPEKYKDENRVGCKCGWKGITHDMVPKNE